MHNADHETEGAFVKALKIHLDLEIEFSESMTDDLVFWHTENQERRWLRLNHDERARLLIDLLSNSTVSLPADVREHFMDVYGDDCEPFTVGQAARFICDDMDRVLSSS